jgi:hypothetical protein
MLATMLPVSVVQSASVMGYIVRCSISRHVTGLFAVLRTLIIFTAVSLDVIQRRLVQIHFFFRKNNLHLSSS